MKFTAWQYTSLGDCPKRIHQIALDFCSHSRRAIRRIASYETGIATNKADKKTSKVVNSLRGIALILTLLMTTTASAQLPAVSCLYQTSIQTTPDTQDHDHVHQSKNVNKWYFWRTNKQVEVSAENQEFGEKWISYDQKNVFYQVLYHDKKFLLNFQPTDLKILGKQASWEKRTTLFPQSILQQLQQKGTGVYKQYDTIHYQGIVAGVSYQVDWIPELKLPLRVEKKVAGQQIVTELREVYPLEKSPYKQRISDQYEDMDYADIGDNESHPIVAQLQKNIGIGYFHQH